MMRPIVAFAMSISCVMEGIVSDGNSFQLAIGLGGCDGRTGLRGPDRVAFIRKAGHPPLIFPYYARHGLLGTAMK